MSEYAPDRFKRREWISRCDLWKDVHAGGSFIDTPLRATF